MIYLLPYIRELIANMKPLTIKQALAWRKPTGALSWVEPHIYCHDGIWVVWYRTDGKHWFELDRAGARQDSISPTKDALSGFAVV
jgi:hypothetical protein